MLIDIPPIPLTTYIGISTVLATPWLFGTLRHSSSSRKGVMDRSLSKTLISLALLVHTLYRLYTLLVSPPPDIFKVLGLPVNIPPEYLKAKLIEVFGGAEDVPLELAVLGKRMGVADLRMEYVRLGHNVLTSCIHCQSSNDFAIYALPIGLLQYIYEIAFIGLLTTPPLQTAYLRPLSLGALLTALLTELYWTLTAQVRIPAFGDESPVVMWHNMFIQVRNILFLILPLFVQVFPYLGLHRVPILSSFIPTPPFSTRTPYPSQQTNPAQGQGQNQRIPPGVTLSQMATLTNQALSHLVPTLHLLKYTHAAVMRSQAQEQMQNQQMQPQPQDHDQDETHLGESSESWAMASGSGSRSGSTLTPQPPNPQPKTYHTLASQWWRTEASEGRVLRSDPALRELLKRSGLGVDEKRSVQRGGRGGSMESGRDGSEEESEDGEEKGGDAEEEEEEGEAQDQDGPLLTSARQAIRMLKEQGARPSEFWVR
ncbi:hypothetical protein CPB83DRAFT_396307 [Crepidotus variabilis]|uniref:Uncharacterized protein n=1 Tax=Crepidotus variabilis TaxID=179855 RepID=A0A9P6EDI2_9AGAR|nr:hypothetical protein CPB83DRAFT_396307 [Crepidotus variabilis]